MATQNEYLAWIEDTLDAADAFEKPTVVQQLGLLVQVEVARQLRRIADSLEKPTISGPTASPDTIGAFRRVADGR